MKKTSNQTKCSSCIAKDEEISTSNDAIVELELNGTNKNSNPFPKWWIWIRDPFHNSSEWLFGWSKVLFYILIFVSILYAGTKFGIEIWEMMAHESTENYTKEMIKYIKEDNNHISSENLKIITKIIENNAEKIVKLKIKTSRFSCSKIY